MRLEFLEKVTAEESEKMIIDMARHSFMEKGFFGTDEQVRDELVAFFGDHGFVLNDVIESCRNHWNTTIPVLEHLDLQRYYAKEGEMLSLENPFYPEENRSVSGPGFIIGHDYLSRYKFAIDCLFTSVKLTNYFYFLSAVSFGISSIDAFLNLGARRWNSEMPNDKMEDSKGNWTSLEKKIDNWVPKLGNGKRFDKLGQGWRDLSVLKGIRDDVAIHPKSTNLSITLEEFRDQTNMFKVGISQVLFDLHEICDVAATKTPSIVVRHCHCPDIVLAAAE